MLVRLFLDRWESDPADDALLVLLRSGGDKRTRRGAGCGRSSPRRSPPRWPRCWAGTRRATGRAGVRATAGPGPDPLSAAASCRHGADPRGDRRHPHPRHPGHPGTRLVQPTRRPTRKRMTPSGPRSLPAGTRRMADQERQTAVPRVSGRSPRREHHLESARGSDAEGLQAVALGWHCRAKHARILRRAASLGRMSDGLDCVPSGMVQGIRPIPPRISLLFREAFNNLRAALDNVIWQLVEAMQGPVTGSRHLMAICPSATTKRGSTVAPPRQGLD